MEPLPLRKPFTGIVAGCTNVGKSVFIQSILKNQTQVVEPNVPWDRIIYAYNVHQPSYNELANVVPNLELFEGNPLPLLDKPEAPPGPGGLLIIFDDLYDVVADDSRLASYIHTGTSQRN